MQPRSHLGDAKASKNTTTGDILKELELELKNNPPPSKLLLKRCLTLSYEDSSGRPCQVYDERYLTVVELETQRKGIEADRARRQEKMQREASFDTVPDLSLSSPASSADAPSSAPKPF